jgi:hypothetical protein
VIAIPGFPSGALKARAFMNEDPHELAIELIEARAAQRLDPSAP